jgi:hypothetical protein
MAIGSHPVLLYWPAHLASIIILFSHWPQLLILFSHWPTQNKNPHGLQDEDEEEEEEDVSSVPPLVLTPQHKGAIRTIRKPHANHVKILKPLKGHKRETFVWL